MKMKKIFKFCFPFDDTNKLGAERVISLLDLDCGCQSVRYLMSKRAGSIDFSEPWKCWIRKTLFFGERRSNHKLQGVQ